ncbi:tryptophan 7-halogenase [Granulosicoccus sp. 3-233]|uniref:tryptophan 7-halogenase n=1 Tax=Granulosicoccus sp. 3-233 TaxID=3417969 RepID=UPI003D32650B
MRIAVLGGGTAGYIAAAHVSHTLPDAQLLHVFDSSIPTIGVGEGTTPRFPMWLKEIAGLDFVDLAQRCNATLKTGVLFEGWGRAGKPFFNRFQPSTLIGYHIDASEIVQIIAEHVKACQIDGFVEAIEHAEDEVTLRLAGGSCMACDFVFDARGFPREEINTAQKAGDIVSLNWIPVNRARLRWLAPSPECTESRAIARAHGWIFQLPLRDRINCGYVFNSTISSEESVEQDFAAFLGDEGVTDWQERGALDFPNFMRRTLCDGRVFRIGNTASFIEPLEATAIGTAIVQVRAAMELIGHCPPATAIERVLVDDYNASMCAYTARNSLFVGWHYSCGSQWQSPFWDHAVEGLQRAAGNPLVASDLQLMCDYIDSARCLPVDRLTACHDQAQWNRDVFPLMSRYLPFGNFSELNFAQVGHGLGYYPSSPVTHSAYSN